MSGHNPDLWKRTKPTLQTDFLVREKIPSWLGNIKNKKILDAGCGEGYVARKLTKLDAKIKAIDKDPKMISLAKSMENEAKQGIEYEVCDILKMKYKNKFDIVLLSGVPPFFNENQLLKAFNNIYQSLKGGGMLLLTTNHTRSYFENGKSNWLEFLTKPNPSLGSQKFKINFYTPDKQKAFTGEAWIHTPEQIKSLLERSGFKIKNIYEPLATKEDLKHFPEMWGDENKIPYHLIIIGEK